MLKAWSIVLLCILLPFQQAIQQVASSSVVVVDKADLEKVLTARLAKENPFQGLVGKNLLEGVVGGSQGEGLLGGSLVGLKFVDLVPPEVHLKFLPDGGIELTVFTKVELKGNSFLTEALDVVVEVNITAIAEMVKDKSGAPQFVAQNCQTSIGQIKIITGSLLQNLGDTLSKQLNKFLPRVLCPVIKLVLEILNPLLNLANEILPAGTLGKLQHVLADAPVLRDQQLILNLNTILTDNEGNTVNLAPSELKSLPPVADHTSKLFISTDLLSSLIKMLVAKGELNVVLSDEALSGTVPMTTSALRSLIPEVSQLLPKDQPLVIKVTISEVPDISFQNGKFSVTLKAIIEVLARTPSGLTPLFVIHADIHLPGKIIITGTKLGLNLSLERTSSLKLASSEIGLFDIGTLENWLKSLLENTVKRLLNDILGLLAPLANIFDMQYPNGEVNIVENAIVVPLSP